MKQIKASLTLANQSNCYKYTEIKAPKIYKHWNWAANWKVNYHKELLEIYIYYTTLYNSIELLHSHKLGLTNIYKLNNRISFGTYDECIIDRRNYLFHRQGHGSGSSKILGFINDRLVYRVQLPLMVAKRQADQYRIEFIKLWLVMTRELDLNLKLFDDSFYGNDTMQIVSNAEMKGKF